MKTLQRAFGAVALTALAMLPAAHAGQITAVASLNPEGFVQNPSGGSFTSADWGTNAHAELTRTAISAMSHGEGVAPPSVYAASGTANTSYTLWDLSTGSALDGGVAAGLTLSFDFTLTGTTSLPPVSLSLATTSWDATLYSSVISANGGGVSILFGPLPPFPNEGYDISGDATLLGSYQKSFSLLHSHAGGGLWTMGFGTSASRAGDAWGTLALAGIHLTEGVLPSGGLAVRLETGELINVSAVPEPAPQWMLLAGLLGIGAFLRRRA